MSNLKMLIILSLKKVIRNKLSIARVILNALIISLIMFVLNFSSSLNHYWKDTIKKSMDYRTLFVFYPPEQYNEKQAIDELLNFSYIQSINKYSSYLITMKANDYIRNDKENGLFLVGAVDNPIDIFLGEDLSNFDSNAKVMICSKQFYPYIELKLDEYKTFDAVDLSGKLGNKISLSFIGSNVEEEFILVGLYDSKKSNMIGNVCYTKWDTVSYLNNKYQADAFEEKEGLYFPLVVVLNNIDYVEQFKIDMEKIGFTATEPVVSIDIELGNHVLETIESISLGIIIAIAIMSILISYIYVENQKYNYAVMKVYGLKGSTLVILNTLENFISWILSVAFSIALYFIFAKIFSCFYIENYAAFNGFNNVISLYNIIIALLLSLALPIVTSCFNIQKINKVVPISILKK